MGQTLSEKVWERHVVRRADGEPDLLYIDLHLVHEVTSPQAFDGLRLNGRTRAPPRPHRRDDGPQRPDRRPRPAASTDPISRQADRGARARTAPSSASGSTGWATPARASSTSSAPSRGSPSPGMTIVCGDSHTSTHGAFGALAFGIGTSEVEHVLATQTLPAATPGTMAITVEGTLSGGVTAKDIVLAIIERIGTGGGIGSVIEYRGYAIRALSMEGRMTVCNMSIEAGAPRRADRARRHDVRVPRGPAVRTEGRGVGAGARRLAQARHRRRRDVRQGGRDRRGDAAPVRHVGHEPRAERHDRRRRARRPSRSPSRASSESAVRALQYMGLQAGTPMRDIPVDTVFIGSCTNSRIEDLRAAAAVADGRHVRDGVRTLVVPGSFAVKAQAESEGLDAVFRAAGFDWREPGCSMCLAMNPDKLAPGERCASTSNRNFEGRQGQGGRTHLVSPAVAAATAIAGHFATPERPGALMDAVHEFVARGGPAAALGRRHRPDHPVRVAQARRAHRLR